jgi:LysR family glycine cleavage system transcriptional activator
MNDGRRRPLGLSNLRAFEAVARQLSFRAAAEETFVTQSAISRQIKSLEDELGAPLFSRGTRHVELTPDGAALLRAVEPALARIDGVVRQIRGRGARARVSVTTFASFASLWLLPRIEAFQRAHPDIDIRILAHDTVSDLDDPDVDVALRYVLPSALPADARLLFGEVMTPTVSRTYMDRVERGELPPLRSAADLSGHTLADEDDHRPSAHYLSWRHWLTLNGLGTLQPRRWLSLNFTYQQVQAALAGHGVALGRIALVSEALERGELVEPFGPAGRARSPYVYGMIVTASGQGRPEVERFAEWIEAEATLTRRALGGVEAAGVEPAPVS